MANSSLLEYARYHGLTIDHKADDLRTYFKPFAPRAFPDEASLLPFELPHAYRNSLEEKFRFSQDAGKLLAEATTAPECLQSSQLLADPHKIQKMKMEVTMLRSNHEKDMRWFRSGIGLDKMIQAEVQVYSREDEEDSDLPDIVSSCSRAMDEVKIELSTERLELGMEALDLLRQSTRSTCTEVERDRCMQSQLSHSKRKTEQVPLTPFLTPTLPPLDVQVQLPDLPDLNLEPASDVTIADHSLSQVALQFDEVGTLQMSDISNGSPGKVRSLLRQSSTAPGYDAWKQGLDADGHHDIGKTPVFDAESLKVEVPMMPSYHGSDLEPKKGGGTAFKDMMDEFIDLSPLQIDLVGGGDIESDEHDTFLLDKIVDQSNEFGKAVMPETIGVNDAALRVEVPQLSKATFSHPATNTSKHDMLESALSHQQVQQVSVDPVEEMSMTWIPVPKHLMRLDMKESIEHTDVLRHLIAAPETIIRSEQLLWKEPGLRILDDDDGDGEIEEMEQAPSLQLIPRSTPKTSVPTKRSADDGPMANNKRTGSIAPDGRSSHSYSPNALVDEIESTQDTPECQQAIQLQPFKIGTVSDQRQHGPQMGPFPAPDLRPMRTLGPFKPKPFKMPCFSASGSVSSFLDLQGKQFKAPSVGIGRDLTIRDPSDPIEVSQVPLDDGQASDPGHSTSTTSEPVLVPSTPLQVVSKQQSPVDVERLDQARTVVIDSALVNNRPLMALLDSDRQQQLTTVYRDLKGCPDLILSPLTCLIYTNLQALTQTGLPGQSTKNMLKDKIAQLAVTYESLYVMVSTSTQVLSSQYDIVADFTFFCSSFLMMEMPVKVIPLWVAIAEGPATPWPEDPIALNTWKLVVREAFRNSKEQLIDQNEHHAPVLIQDETVWEVFLCRAGTNPIAAQVILGTLKKTGAQKEAWGLRRLVRMSSEERLQHFTGLVGRKCIEHLNHVLDSSCS